MADDRRQHNGGRPPMYDERMVGTRATVPQSYKEGIREIGDGNYSAGVRRLYEEWVDRHGDPTD